MAGRVTFAGGVAGTEGIIHSGIGPFDIDSGSRLTYFTARYQKGGRRVAFFTNLLNGDAVEPAGARTERARCCRSSFDTKTFDVEARRRPRHRHAARRSATAATSATTPSTSRWRPNGDNRNEGGAYVQDEIFLSDQFRWVVGGRVDKFSSIENAVFSPRTTLMFKPDADADVPRLVQPRVPRAVVHQQQHRRRRSSTQVNLSARQSGAVALRLPDSAPSAIPISKQETMTAYEVGYTGVIAQRATVTAAVYWNNTEGRDLLHAGRVVHAGQSAADGWPPPIPAFVPGLNPPPGCRRASRYLNLGTVKDKGIELGVDAVGQPVRQRVRELLVSVRCRTIEDFAAGTTINDINWPAKNRFNAGFNFSYGRFLGNFVGELHRRRPTGRTCSMCASPARPTRTRWSTAASAYVARQNAWSPASRSPTSANQEVQQHIFGDILKRQVIGEVRFGF